MYLHGHGVANSLTEAKQWFRKAALQGHPNAKKELRNRSIIGAGDPTIDWKALIPND